MALNPSSLRAAASLWPRSWLSIAPSTSSIDVVSRHLLRCLPSVAFERTKHLIPFVQGLKSFGFGLGVEGRTDPWVLVVYFGQIGVDPPVGGLHPKSGRLKFILKL